MTFDLVPDLVAGKQDQVVLVLDVPVDIGHSGIIALGWCAGITALAAFWSIKAFNGGRIH